jgi:hypothetical protein
VAEAAEQVPVEDAELWAQHVMLGRWDRHLGLIVKAIGERAVVAAGGVRWRLNWADQDLVVDEDNLTLLEVERAEQLSGKTWLSLNPRQSAKDCIAFLQAAVELRKEMSAKDARAALSGLTMRQVGDMLVEYVADGPVPFDSADPSTT